MNTNKDPDQQDIEFFIEKIKHLEGNLEIATKALGRIRFSSLDDRTPERFIKDLKKWRDQTCRISYEALVKIGAWEPHPKLKHEENDCGHCWCNPKVIKNDKGEIKQIIHNKLSR
jgi:hypothetical protein